MSAASDTASNSKVRLFCIVASFIGLACLGDVLGWAAEPGLEPPNKVYDLTDLDEHLHSQDEIISATDLSKYEQVPPPFMPKNLRSIVSCGLLLLVMFINIQATFESSCPSTEKGGRTKGSIRDSFTSFMKSLSLSPQRLLTNPFFWFGMLVLAVIGAYEILYMNLKARGSTMSTTAWYPFFSVSAEGFGILSLRQRIRRSGAQGISAKTVALFAILYIDTAFSFPDMNARQLDIWACKVLEWVSLVLVMDVLYSILTTHRETYQKELDIVPVKAMVGACVLLAFMYQPPRVNKEASTIGFTFRIYLDTFAFVPQVVMMSLQDHPVNAPIAHFVAANTMGRFFDLAFWLDEFKFWAAPFKMPFSGWLICLLHVASLVVVADFFYYYVKTWIAGRGFMEDVPIPIGIDV